MPMIWPLHHNDRRPGLMPDVEAVGKALKHLRLQETYWRKWRKRKERAKYQAAGLSA